MLCVYILETWGATWAHWYLLISTSLLPSSPGSGVNFVSPIFLDFAFSLSVLTLKPKWNCSPQWERQLFHHDDNIRNLIICRKVAGIEFAKRTSLHASPNFSVPEIASLGFLISPGHMQRTGNGSSHPSKVGWLTLFSISYAVRCPYCLTFW